MEVLLLSNGYVPVKRIDWFKAISWALTGRVVVLEEYADQVIRSSTKEFPTPSVVKFARHSPGFFRKGVRFSRRNVWIRDNGRCAYCGEKVPCSDMTLDHIVPRATGGETEWGNVVTCCVTCNREKGARTPKQAGMKLLVIPTRPKSLPGVSLDHMGWHESMPEDWKEYFPKTATA